MSVWLGLFPINRSFASRFRRHEIISQLPCSSLVQCTDFRLCLVGHEICSAAIATRMQAIPRTPRQVLHNLAEIAFGEPSQIG